MNHFKTLAATLNGSCHAVKYFALFYPAEKCPLIRLLMLSVLLALSIPAAPAQYQYPFQDSALPPEQRITGLLSRMTLQEKTNLLGNDLNVPRLGVYGSPLHDSIPGSSGQVEGLHGLAMGGENQWEKIARRPGA